MSTAKRLTHIDNESQGYFEDLPASTQKLVRELMAQAAEDRSGPDGWKSEDECFSDVECHARDGFMPFSHNRGGLMYRNFADLQSYWGGGYALAHEKANAELQRQIETALNETIPELVREAERETVDFLFGERWKEALRCHELEELKNVLEKQGRDTEHVKHFQRLVEEEENNQLSGENASVMHEIRFMYHGKEDGLHSASVSAAVNLEAPYHRSRISWAPQVFCEGAKEVEITWRNQAELKRKLARALKQVSKAIF